MTKKNRRKYTAEEKAEAVRLAERSGNLTQVARDLDINGSTLRLWVEKAKTQGPGGALAESEREELLRLRRENKRLREERSFLKKTSAYFAKASDSSK